MTTTTSVSIAIRRAGKRTLGAAALTLAIAALLAARQGAAAAPAEPGQPDHRGGPIIIIDPGWPFPAEPFPRHCPHPCPRLIIRFPCGNPAAGLLPGDPGLPNPGATAGPTATVRPMPSPTPGGVAAAQTYKVCPQLLKAIPQAVQDAAVAEPWRVYGFNQKSNPNIPFHPLWNPYRTWLSLRDPRQPYSICNTPLWKAGCP